MRRLASIFSAPALVLLLSLAACEPTVPEGRFACETDEDCPDELVCRTRVRRCFSTQVDAGPSDSGASDPGDASAHDAGS